MHSRPSRDLLRKGAKLNPQVEPSTLGHSPVRTVAFLSVLRRVVVTGVGIATPFGSNLDTFWSALVQGYSCISEITRLDTTDYPVHIGGQVVPPEETAFLPGSVLRHNDLCTNIGLLAGGLALDSAGLESTSDERRPISVIVGSAFSATQGLQDVYGSFFKRGWRKMHPLAVPRNMFNSLASNLSIQYRLAGSHHTIAAACASSAVAVGEGYLRIRYGEDDLVLAGGADAAICGSVLGGWANLRVLSRNPDPIRACRPFDSRRDGLVISEGAALLVLEEYEHARRRRAHSFGEIIGYGATSDATHLTAPSSKGQGAAITRALHSAGLAAEDVDYINAHGTSTRLNDQTETEAIKQALGEHSRKVAISASKSMLGHTMGASGALELVVTLLALRHGVIPPTINHDSPDPDCDLDYVPNNARRGELRVALKNSFAFGGQNAVLAVRKPEEKSA